MTYINPSPPSKGADDAISGGVTLALDRPLTLTVFASVSAQAATEESVSLRALVPRLQTKTANSKAELPLLKLAAFGDARTAKGSVRFDANILSIDGIEADYDAERVSPDDAAVMLEAFDVAGVVYTSPSHTEDSPRWRVLCPTSKSLPPIERAGLLGRLNGIFAGALAGESWTLSQAFYFGSVRNNPSHKVIAVDGRPIDLATELLPVGKRGRREAPEASQAPAGAGPDRLAPMPDEAAVDDGALVAELVSGLSYHESLRDLSARYVARGMPAASVTMLLRGLMESCAAEKRDARWRERYAEIAGLVASAVAKFAPPAVAVGAEIFDPWERVIPPCFPEDCLPDQLREVVTDVARRMGTDYGATAMAHLAAVAACVDSRTSLRVKRLDLWEEHPCLWLMLVGDPAAKKTPLLSTAVKHLRQHEARAGTRYRLAKDAWEKTPKAERTGPEPVADRFVINDTTPEKAAEIAANNPRGITAVLDELVGWISAMDQYTGTGKGAGAGRAFWLTAYQGEPYTQDRIGRGTIVVENLAISILGGVQLERLKQIKGLTADGLLQRFIPVIMGRATLGEDKAPSPAVNRHNAHLAALLAAPPRKLYLDNAGHEIREAAFRWFDDLSHKGMLGQGFATFCGKAAALMARLAIALHFADPASLEAGDGLLSSATAQRARTLMGFVIRNAAAFYRELEGTGGSEETQALASFIVRWGKDEVKLRDFVAGVRPCRGCDERENLRKISVLVGAGWLSPASGTYPCKAWTIAPGLREHFAERAQAEAARCAQMHELIRAETDCRGGLIH